MQLYVNFFVKNIHCLSFIRIFVMASFPEQTFSQDLVAKWERDTQKSRGWEVLGNCCPTEPMEIVFFSILSLKDCCNDWENFCLILTRILMLSLQVYFSVSSVEMVAADMGKSLMMYVEICWILSAKIVCLKAFLLLNVVFQKCVFPCRGTTLCMQSITMKSLIQAPSAGKEDTPKVQGESPAFLLFEVVEFVCLSICISKNPA